MPTEAQVAEKMGKDVAEVRHLIFAAHSTGDAGIAKALMAGYGWGEKGEFPNWIDEGERENRNAFVTVDLRDFAASNQVDESELVALLRSAGCPVNVVARGVVDVGILHAAALSLRGEAPRTQLEEVIRTSPQTQITERSKATPPGALVVTWDGLVPTIQITPDMAALLSLSPISEAIAPADHYRVAIVAPFCGLQAIEASGQELSGKWTAAAPTTDLAEPIRNIALGACDLLSKSGGEPRDRHEPDPIAKTEARMRETITVKIRTLIGEAIKAAARDVFEGRRGYSAVLQESIPVRAHLARYRVGPGRKEEVLILRAAHRRGGPGDRQRRYVLKS